MMSEITELWSHGGFVMPFLVGGLLVLWYGIGWRALTLRRGDGRSMRVLVAEARGGRLTGTGVMVRATREAVEVTKEAHGHLAQELEYALAGIHDELAGYRSIVGIVVILAPLAGLLGTVTGMIETFDSLAEMALFTQGGGVAGGISEALISTQMGLAVAIPGVIFGRLLDRRQQLLEDELDQLVEHLAMEAS